MATVPAAARPISVSIGMPTTDSPASAMTTVSPAKTTALPGGADGAADGLLGSHALGAAAAR